MRIRTRLLLLVLALLVPAILTAGLATYSVYEEARQDNRDNMREMTHVLALLVDQEIARRIAILETLATSPALDEADLARFYEQARRAAPTQENAIILIDLQERMVVHTRQRYGTPLAPDLEIMRTLRQRAGSEARLISNVMYSPTAQQYSFTVQIPVRRQGKVIYYLSMSTVVSQLQVTLRQLKLPASWLATIVDDNGIVVARSQDAEKYVGQQISAAKYLSSPMPKMRTKMEGLAQGTSLNGEKVTAFYSRAPRSGWLFIVSVSQRELLQTALNAALMMGGMLLSLLLLAIATAIGLGRSTARQIESLGEAAAQLGSGQTLIQPPADLLEVDAVRHALLQADTQINRSAADMEQRVAEAVALAERTQQALVHAQKLEALGRLTGGIAHDFNNVLQTLTTGLQVAAHGAQEERALNALEICSRAVDSAADLVRRLMVFGKVQQARHETINVTRRIQLIMPMLHSALGNRVNLLADLADDIWPVTIDPLQLELALLNLSINARDAMPEGGELRLQVKNCTLSAALIHRQDELAAGEYVVISVADNGIGMTQETMQQAIDPFFTTKKIGEGTGLGLPQIHGFARQSGGMLVLDSTLGQGTTVTFYLPRAKADAMVYAPALTDHSLSGADFSGTHSGLLKTLNCARTVLLVEDDPLVRSVVAPALTGAGYRVELVENGEQAMARLKSAGGIDLVFSDIVMPGSVSGTDLTKWLRDYYPEVGIVLASGYVEHQTPLRGIRILSKPYQIKDMLQALEVEWQAQLKKGYPRWTVD